MASRLHPREADGVKQISSLESPSPVDWTQYLRQYDMMVSLNRSYAAVKRSVVGLMGEALAGEDGGLVVDVGCGTGQLLIEVAPRFPQVSFLGVDADQACLALLSERVRAGGLRNVQLQCSDARSWRAPEPVRVCSFMHSLYTLGPLDDPEGPRAALTHARAALRPGGHLILTDIQRRLRYRRWAAYIFVTAVREHGLFTALRIFKDNASARHANIAIERAQRAGRMVLADLDECVQLVRSVGFERIIHASDKLYAPGVLGEPIDNQVVAVA